MSSTVVAETSAGGDPEIAALRHGVDGVDHHGQHDLLDLVGIAAHVRQLFAQREIELDGRHVHLVLHQPHAAVDDLVEVAPLQVHGRDTRKRKQVLDQLATTLALAGDQVERAGHLFAARSGGEIVLDPALHHARVGQDAGERVVDLVGDDSGHLADGGHLLHLQHVLVRLLEFAGLLLDAVFQGAGPGGDLGLRQLQAAAHVVERLRQVARSRRWISRESGSRVRPWRRARCRPSSARNGLRTTTQMNKSAEKDHEQQGDRRCKPAWCGAPAPG